jgi:hypothetical protein
MKPNMKRVLCLSVVSLLAVGIAQAQFVINTSPGVFDPSFRGQGNTTWFGWASGSFEGAVNNELIDNPATTIGVAPLGLSFTQSPATNDILSSSENIYTGSFPSTDLLISVPTSGTQGAGFTTIIVQGRTAFGDFGALPVFNLLGGDAVNLVATTNMLGRGQFWAKFEIVGNEPMYNMVMTLGNFPAPISIAELEFDTFWSASGFAPDYAIVPEPSTAALLGIGALGFTFFRRSRKLC